MINAAIDFGKERATEESVRETWGGVGFASYRGDNIMWQNGEIFVNYRLAVENATNNEVISAWVLYRGEIGWKGQHV